MQHANILLQMSIRGLPPIWIIIFGSSSFCMIHEWMNPLTDNTLNSARISTISCRNCMNLAIGLLNIAHTDGTSQSIRDKVWAICIAFHLSRCCVYCFFFLDQHTGGGGCSCPRVQANCWYSTVSSTALYCPALTPSDRPCVGLWICCQSLWHNCDDCE